MNKTTVEHFKACVDCRHFKTGKAGVSCLHPKADLKRLDPVYGTPVFKKPHEMRLQPKMGMAICGPLGILWQPLPTPIRDRLAAARMVVQAAPGRTAAWAAGKVCAWRLWAAHKRMEYNTIKEPVTVEPVQVELPLTGPHPLGREPGNPDPAPQVPVVQPQPESERSARGEAKLGLAVVIAAVVLLGGIMTAHAVHGTSAPLVGCELRLGSNPTPCCYKDANGKRWCGPCRKA